MRILGWMFLMVLMIMAILAGKAQNPVVEADGPQTQNDRNPTQEEWVARTLNGLSLEEQIGQLLMVPVYSSGRNANGNAVLSLVKRYGVGGVIFMQGAASDQLMLANNLQMQSKVPLLVAQDAEWGLDMRLKDGPSYPKAMTLGAIRDDSLLFYLGQRMAIELRRCGVQMNFAPVFDVNINPENPVIGERAFSDNPYVVARKGILVAHGMESMGVMACAKHFPGHGDTEVDSHVALPTLNHNLSRLDTVELYPFYKAVESGIGAVMVGHLQVPALNGTSGLPATLSPEIIENLLRRRLNFDGLIVTDALNMGAVAGKFSPGELELTALMAGNDILLFPGDVPQTIKKITQAVRSGELSMVELQRHVKRVLRAKYRLGLSSENLGRLKDLSKDLWSADGRVLRDHLYQAALTLVQNENSLLPLRFLDRRRIAYVQIGGEKGEPFEMTLRKYADITPFYLPRDFSAVDKQRLLSQLDGFNTVITGVYDLNSKAPDKGIHYLTPDLFEALVTGPWQVVATIFGTPYALKYFGRENSILVAYEEAESAQIAAGSAIFGGQRIDGRLPVTASRQFPLGSGIRVERPLRYGFARPEAVGMDSETLERIDSIALDAIAERATPGCAVLILRGNEIVFEKGYGKTEYTQAGTPVDPFLHTYDLASVTKVIATTALTMRFVENGQLDLDRPISYYLPELIDKEIGKLPPRRLLQHNGGLPGWIPFYEETYTDVERRQLDPFFYAFDQSTEYPISIAPGLFSRPALQQSVWHRISDIPVRRTKRVRYSDIGLILMGRVLERIAGMPLEHMAATYYYQPLGMSQTRFNPAMKGYIDFCPPTEVDTIWRRSVIQGYVHDPAAAILGGCAGHAGLFSNVYDLAKMLQMLKAGGLFGGDRYLRPETIDYFTSQQLKYSRKGLGWDKPEIDPRHSQPTSEYASPSTFGHTGFTGTCVWVDPHFDVIYIFLSNRTFPWASNRRLLRMDVRQRIMDVIYESIFAYQMKMARKEMP